MRLSTFISKQMGAILDEWDRYARTMKPAADTMSFKDLRDHAESMLQEIARDLGSSQTASEQQKKSEGTEDDCATSAAARHGQMRQDDRFTLVQLSAEFRALRATVLRMWLPTISHNTSETLDDVVRFNEAIDQAFAESIVTFSSRTEQARDMYDAILGHDLRGPLATMSMAGALLGKPLNEDVRAKLAANVTRAARFMTAMVDDLLLLSRIKLSKGIRIRRAPVDVAAMCEAAVVDAGAMHPESTFELAIDGRRDAELDTVRMHQLLVNLLGNAGQHGSNDHPIRVEIHGSDPEVCISVSNQGERIGKDALRTIFEPMTQVVPDERSSEPAKTSLGLGLHIASEIAAAHDGTIGVTSTDERTTFTVRLPREFQRQD